MAFFNLTQLGVQDPIKHALLKSEQEKNDPALSININAMIGSSKTSANVGDNKSHAKYTEHLCRHQRKQKAPNEIYSTPITASQDYGWWKQDGAPETLPWAKIPRFSRVNSEMTRFVDEMTLTNKHFTLF